MLRQTKSTMAIIILMAINAHETTNGYRVDCSFPIDNHKNQEEEEYIEERLLFHLFECNDAFSGDRQNAFYKEYMNGCKDFYSSSICENNEQLRMKTTFIQRNEVPNLTATGYELVQVPPKIHEKITQLWDEQKDTKQLESWDKPSPTGLNHWSSPTFTVKTAKKNNEDASNKNRMFLRGSLVNKEENDNNNNNNIWDQLQAVTKTSIEQWTGLQVQQQQQQDTTTSSSLIRIYSQGSITPPHVVVTPSKKPSSSSLLVGIYNVAEELQDPWVFELYSRIDGQAQNITISPGEMLLYEASSIIHGNSFPLNGKFMATMSFYYEPIIYFPEATIMTSAVTSTSDEANKKENQKQDEQRRREEQPTKELFNQSVALLTDYTSSSSTLDESKFINNKNDIELPPSSADNDDDDNNNNNNVTLPSNTNDTTGGNITIQSLPAPKRTRFVYPKKRGPQLPDSNYAAAHGNLNYLQLMAQADKLQLFAHDINGWEPIHEAARFGHVQIIELLVSNGVDVNSISNFGDGYSPLYLAERNLQPDHPALQMLQSLGAKSVGRNLES